MEVHIDRNSIKHILINCICPIIGGILGLLIGWIIGYLPICFISGLSLGIGVAIGASIAREYDGKKSGGHWCWWDILFDTLGIIIGSSFMCLIGYFII